MSSLNRSGFITSVPFTDAMAAGEDRRAQRLRNEAAQHQIQQQEQAAAQEQAVDAAIRSGLSAGQPAPVPGQPVQPAIAGAPVTVAPPQPGTGQAPVAMQPLQPQAAQPSPQGVPQAQQQALPGGMANVQARLQQTPGGGKLALALAQADQKRRDDDEGNVMRFLSNPSTQHLGLALAQKVGMNLPPDLVSNSNFWAGASIAKDLYGDDHASAQRFTSAFVQQQGGDIQQRVAAATAAAGAPVKKKRYGHVTDDGNIIFYNLDNPADRQAIPRIREGAIQYGDDGSMFRVAGSTATPITIAGTDTQLKGQKFRQAGGAAAAANTLVKIGQNSGKLYPADFEGVGDGGEAIVAMPAAAAARIAVAKGNNQTQITLREMIGDDQMNVQGARNQGAAAVAGINADSRLGVAKVQGTTQRDVAGIRSDAQIGAAQVGAQARTDAASIQGNTARDVAETRRAGQENSAQTRAGASLGVADINRAGRENSATTAADARRDVAGTQAGASLERQQLANQGRTDAARIGAEGRSGAGARQSVFEQKRQAAIAAGMTPHEALKYANGLKQITPQQEERMALDMAKKLSDAEMMPKGEQWVQNKANEILAGWRGSRSPAGGSPVAPTPPQAQGGAASPFQQYPSARQAPDGQWYIPDPDRPGKYLRIVQDGGAK